MLSPSLKSSLPARSRASLLLRGGFTLLEMFIALAVLGTMSAGCYIGFNAINTYSVTSRLFSEAMAAAQNQTDLVLSKEPFDIMSAYLTGSFDPSLNKVPIEVMTTAEIDAVANSGVPFPTAAPSATPLKTDPYYPYYPYYRSGAGQPLSREAFIYTDPTTGTVMVRGVLTTTIADTNMVMDYVNTGTKLNTRRATVTVTYTFRGRTYNVSMDTLRTANQ